MENPLAYFFIQVQLVVWMGLFPIIFGWKGYSKLLR